MLFEIPRITPRWMRDFLGNQQPAVNSKLSTARSKPSVVISSHPSAVSDLTSAVSGPVSRRLTDCYRLCHGWTAEAGAGFRLDWLRSDLRYPISDIRYPILDTLHPMSSIGYAIFDDLVRFVVFYVQDFMNYILCR